MRRSAAPSQLRQAAKRPRFQPPVLASGSQETCNVVPKPERSVGDILALIDKERPAKQNTFKPPTENNEASNSATGVEDASDKENANDSRTFTLGSIQKNVNTKNELSDPYLDKHKHCSTEADVPNLDVSSELTINSLADDKLLNLKQNGNVSDSTPIPAQTNNIVPDISDKNPSPENTQSYKPIAKSNLQSFKPKFKAPGTVGGQTGFKTPKFKPPAQPNTQANGVTQPKDASITECVKSFYYSCMWCKLSKKKHKKWEGDAILIAKGRSVTLVDMEGKEIGRGSGYKTKELETLDEGHSLCVGGKELEIMGKIAESEFVSGKCFQAAAKVASPPKKKPLSMGASKPFTKPTKDGSHLSQPQPPPPQSVKPRFDPTAPDALVLPRPGQAHEWEYNKQGTPVVDVVVDPYLSQHLRPHQREGVAFLYQCIMGMKNYAGNGAILADEMGLGKTLQCISLIWTLLKQGPYGCKPVIKRTIIITPGSLVKNWLREFKKWLGNERLKVFAVGSDNKIEEFKSAMALYPVLVISYEMFIRCIEDIRSVNIDLIVCDEGHRLKNTNIKTTSLVSSLPTRKRIVLTGTPVQNDLQELYSIVDFCNPGILGSSVAFRHVYEGSILASRQPNASPADKQLGETRAAELNRITGMFILRRTSDINNKYLPPKVELVMFCRPSPLQLSLYRKLISSRIVRSCVTNPDTAQHLMCISALKKLCNHPALIHKNALKTHTRPEQDIDEVDLYEGLYNSYPDNFDPDHPIPTDSGKLKTLDQLLHAVHHASPRERIVVVSNYTQTLDVIEELCNSREYQFLRLDGQTPTAKRQQLVERFNNSYSQDFVFLLSSKAGGVGLNLIGASRLVLYDIDWNPANDLQAMARVWRDGQRKRVFIYRLLTTGSIEEKMYQRQITKQGLSGVVVDAKASNSKMCFSPEELKDLFKVQENTLCATHDLMQCTCGGNPNEQTTVSQQQQNRTCQLALPKNMSKNKCMDELMDWKHLAGPDPCLNDVDAVLGATTLCDVTYALWNENNSTVE